MTVIHSEMNGENIIKETEVKYYLVERFVRESRDKILESEREFYQRNRTKILSKQRRYYERNRTKIRDRRSKIFSKK